MKAIPNINPKNVYDRFSGRYKTINLPTNVGWSTSNAGSGAVYQYPSHMILITGATANSRALASTLAYGLTPAQNAHYLYSIYFDKRLEWDFALTRENSDPEVIARIQLKRTSTEGALTDIGVGIEIQNMTMYGEGYGSARSTCTIGSLTNLYTRYIRIVVVPGDISTRRVEFWVDNQLAGTLTGNAVPYGYAAVPHYSVVSIINGATGGVIAGLYFGNIRLVQEY